MKYLMLFLSILSTMYALIMISADHIDMLHNNESEKGAWELIKSAIACAALWTAFYYLAS